MDIHLDILFAQLINFTILFFIFKKFLTDPIVKTIESKRELVGKLVKADIEYEEKIEQAKKEAKKIIDNAKNDKESIIVDATNQAKLKQEKILQEANSKADLIMIGAKEKADKIASELNDNFENGVKTTAKIVLKKIFEEDVQLQQKYFDKIVTNFKV